MAAVASCNRLLTNAATYLLTINSPTLKSVAMNLYDVASNDDDHHVKCLNPKWSVASKCMYI